MQPYSPEAQRTAEYRVTTRYKPEHREYMERLYPRSIMQARVWLFSPDSASPMTGTIYHGVVPIATVCEIPKTGKYHLIRNAGRDLDVMVPSLPDAVRVAVEYLGYEIAETETE